MAFTTLARCVALAACVFIVWPLFGQTPRFPKAPRPKISQGSLNNGDAAPDFSLRAVDGKSEVTLSQLRGKPVVLIFGSCTCPPFVASLKSVERLHAEHQDRVHFYIVYIREAHPVDGWAISNNQFQVTTPTTLKERQKIAQDFAAKLHIPIPVLVDGIEDQVEKSYSVWPNRMYILDADGKIVDKGTAGPGGVANSSRTASDVLESLLLESK
jgi:thiol-disulfide isomerase/thioredoxin